MAERLTGGRTRGAEAVRERDPAVRRAVPSVPEQHRAPASEGGGRGQHAIVGFTPGSRTNALGLPEATITDTRPTAPRKTAPSFC